MIRLRHFYAHSNDSLKRGHLPFFLLACPDSQFPCSSERSECIDGVQFCDGVPDCPNGSDETFCRKFVMSEQQL